jgi:hypothetical protein
MRHALCRFIFSSCSLALLPLLFPALAQSSGSNGIAFSVADLPGGPASGIVQGPRQLPVPDAAAVARTGAKKGILGSSLAAEVKASPDAAVLNAGLAQEWRLLLADLGEPSTLVGPDELAAAGRTKPFLIIPSGALAAYGGSAFFRAGLAEFVRSGGIILCFSQQRGIDLSALPLDKGAKIEAAGWSEDAGPLFRASAIQQQHPFLSGETTALPGIETDGYFTSYPENAAVLLARHDGFPTLIIYPFGSGWVVASTLFSERLHALGHLGAEERSLLRDMVSWAKAGGKVRTSAANRRVDLELELIGLRDIDAAAVKLLMIGPDRSVTATEKTLQRPVPRRAKLTVPVSFSFHSDAPQGIHHVEYVLLDSRGRSLTTARESVGGWVSLGNASKTGTITRAAKPLAAPQLLISDATALITSVGSTVRMDLNITTGPGAELPQPILVRAGGRERIVQLTKERTSISLDLPTGSTQDSIPFTLSLSGNGRVLFRGSAEPPSKAKGSIFLERASFASGEPVRIGTKGLGSGELTFYGLGSIQDSMISGSKSVEFTAASDLPDGDYPLRWEFRSMDDSILKGILTLPHQGYRVRFQSLSVKEKSSWWRSRIEAGLGITATAPVAGRLRLQLRGPAGTEGPALEKEIKLMPGLNDLTLALPFKPSQAGIWELQSSFLVTLPDGAGLLHKPVIIASAIKVFDAGKAAVLGISTERPLYEDPSGPVQATVSIFGSGAALMTVSLDGNKMKSEKLELSGHNSINIKIDTLKEGAHTLSADLRLAGLSSYQKLAFPYGTNLPDLALELSIPEPAGASLPITLLVRNQGRTSSASSRAALLEGLPSDRGQVVGSITVPALKSGETYSTVLEWPLLNKAGSQTLHAVADVEGMVTEADKENNSNAVFINIPETVFSLAPQKNTIFSDEEMEFHAAMVNLTSRSLEGLNVQFQLFGPRGALMTSEQSSVPLLGPGAAQRITRSFRLPSASFGVYRAAAVLTKDRVIAEADASLTLLPTPLLQGTLVGTPAATGSCRPFTITYDARSAGNVPVTEGTVKARIAPAASGQQSITKEAPFSQGAGSFRIGKLDLPSGNYTVQLTGSATNRNHKVTRETVMAEQPLSVTAPVSVRQNSSPVPRVLVLRSALEQGAKKVVTRKLLDDAFDREGIFHTVVDKPADFIGRAGSGLYNTFVLFEPDEMLDEIEDLKQRVQDGDGLIIVGEGRISMTIAESFGFTFAPALPDDTRLLDVGGELRSALTGTLPVCGPLLPPARKGARSLAQLSGSGQPAMLIGSHGKGKVLVMPFSLTRSAAETGSIPLYGLLLCTALPSVQPEQDSPGGIIARELTVTAAEGSARTRIIDRLPEGAQVMQSGDAVVKNGAIVYDVTAEAKPKRLLYLYRLPTGSIGPVSREVQYECGGNFISEGPVPLKEGDWPGSLRGR